jgi:hypothetical protein
MNEHLAQEHAVAYLDNELSARERKALEAHIAGCAVCQQEIAVKRRLYERTRGAIKATQALNEAPPETWGKIAERLSLADPALKTGSRALRYERIQRAESAESAEGLLPRNTLSTVLASLAFAAVLVAIFIYAIFVLPNRDSDVAAPPTSTAAPTRENTAAPTPTRESTVTPMLTLTPPPPAGTDITLDLPEGDAEAGALQGRRWRCDSCHITHNTGPYFLPSATGPAVSVRAASVIEEPDYTGSATTAEEYLIESILLPDAYVVPGWALTGGGPGEEPMPDNYGEKLTAQELADIIAWLWTFEDAGDAP